MYNSELLLKELERRISMLPLSDSPDRLYAPIRYIMEDGGKRMRPLLTLMACDIYGDVRESVYSASIGIEVFHNFTLLHDDIMDKAPIRRNRPTVHVKWNDSVAILSGDAMLILAYHLFSSDVEADKLPTVLSIFNRASIEVCEGQQYDMDFEETANVSIDQYIEMIRLKTSVLMAAALEIGAYLGGATDAQRSNIYDFGVNLGLAFQIQDDILDTYGNQDTFGKTIGGDISVGKKTYLYLTALNHADTAARVVLCNSHDYNEVRAVYDSLDVRSKAEAAVQHYFDQALQYLSKCHDDPNKLQILKEYAYQLLRRDK